MRIQFERMNFESECAHDIIWGRGFLINQQPYADIDKSIKNMDGPRSPRYGSSYSDVQEFNDRYRCECQRTIGAAFEGEICPFCGKKVEYKDVDILYTGWINFAPYKIISP